MTIIDKINQKLTIVFQEEEQQPRTTTTTNQFFRPRSLRSSRSKRSTIDHNDTCCKNYGEYFIMKLKFYITLPSLVWNFEGKTPAGLTLSYLDVYSSTAVCTYY